MGVLSELVSGISAGTIEVIDLTAPLSSETPILKLPPPFADTITFGLEEISRYDDRGPRGTGTTSAAASTPAPTSTLPTTG